MNVQDRNGSSPLYMACCFNYIEIIKTLLNYGANINIMNNDKKTLLDIAYSNGRTEVAEILLDYGSNDNYSQPTNV